MSRAANQKISWKLPPAPRIAEAAGLIFCAATERHVPACTRARGERADSVNGDQAPEIACRETTQQPSETALSKAAVQLCKDLILAGAALQYPHLAAGLIRKSRLSHSP